MRINFGVILKIDLRIKKINITEKKIGLLIFPKMTLRIKSVLLIPLICISHYIEGQKLIVNYDFNEGSLIDKSENNLHLKNTGAIPDEDRNSISNNSYRFNGVNSFMEINNNELIISDTDFTIAFWARMDGRGGGEDRFNQVFSHRKNETGNTSVIGFKTEGGTGNIEFTIRTVNGVTEQVTYPAVSYGGWYFYAGVCDNEQMRLFLNGQLVAQIPFTQAGGQLDPIDFVYLGRVFFNNRNRGFFNGAIDDFRIYDCALSDEEIVFIYDNSQVNLDPPAILSFELPGQVGESIINTEEQLISILVDCLTDVTSLIPSFDITNGSTAFSNNEIFQSGVDSYDFTESLELDLRTEGCTGSQWEVEVEQIDIENDEELISTNILDFKVSNQEEYFIDTDKREITIEVGCTIELSKIQPIITLNDGSEAITTFGQIGVETVELLVTNKNTCQQSLWNIIIKESQKELFIPNVITPNGDNLNDFFEVTNKNSSDIISLSIYNRWGRIVYNSKAYKNNWNANNLSGGMYYYSLKSIDCDQVFKGWVQALK